MAYKALRVPISILQQKAYGAGHRLDLWEGLVEAEEKPRSQWSGRVFTANSRSFEGMLLEGDFGHSDKITLMSNLFDKTPHLRQFFYLVDGLERTMCRYCGEPAKDNKERSVHIGCYHPTRQINTLLRADLICVICNQPTNMTEMICDYNSCPVCSESCLYTWDCMNPDAFEFQLKVLEEAQKGRERAYENLGWSS